MKYIYIDSNQYRHIYSSSQGFSQEIYDLLVRLIDREHVQLLLPQQTKEEVERNRYRAWPETEDADTQAKIDKLKERVEKIKREYGSYRGGKALLSDLNKELKRLEKEKLLVAKKFTNLHSAQNRKIIKLFRKAQYIAETPEVCAKAEMRLFKGNPPYGKDKKIGDSLIWEILLSHLQQRRNELPRMIFVSNDKNAWGRESFDPWLAAEYTRLTRGKIIFSNRLSDIPDLTQAEQERIRNEEAENLKKNAVSDFVASHSFINAGNSAQGLLRYKEMLTEDDYKKIVSAAVSNHEIYQSFFTSVPLGILLEGERGYVVSGVESISGDLWERFEKRYKTGLKRQSSENASGSKESEIDPEDIPF